MKPLNVIQPFGATQVNSSPSFPFSGLSPWPGDCRPQGERRKTFKSSGTVTLLASSRYSVLSLYHSNCMRLRHTHKSGQKGKEGKYSSCIYSCADVSNHLRSHSFRKYMSTYHAVEARDTAANKRDTLPTLKKLIP